MIYQNENLNPHQTNNSNGAAAPATAGNIASGAANDRRLQQQRPSGGLGMGGAPDNYSQIDQIGKGTFVLCLY